MKAKIGSAGSEWEEKGGLPVFSRATGGRGSISLGVMEGQLWEPNPYYTSFRCIICAISWFAKVVILLEGS